MHDFPGLYKRGSVSDRIFRCIVSDLYFYGYCHFFTTLLQDCAKAPHNLERRIVDGFMRDNVSLFSMKTKVEYFLSELQGVPIRLIPGSQVFDINNADIKWRTTTQPHHWGCHEFYAKWGVRTYSFYLITKETKYVAEAYELYRRYGPGNSYGLSLNILRQRAAAAPIPDLGLA